MNIIGKIKIWFGISALMIIIGLATIAIYGLKPGIDFAGGSLLEISDTSNISKTEISKLLADSGFKEATITTAGKGELVIKSQSVNQVQEDNFIKKINAKIGDSGKVTVENFQTIGPIVSQDLIKKSIYSVILAVLGIIAYITFAFRKMPDKNLSLRFGFSAVFALLHDLLFTVGMFAIAADFLHWQIDSLFITALLTVMGFSVHDTIVVFDRIRENLTLMPNDNFETVVNESVTQTLARSLNTSLTILITLASLLILVGASIRPFIFTLFMGIFVGTYSSIFIASPTVVIWQRLVDNKKIK
jgi:preprotein translocase subunit SecF